MGKKKQGPWFGWHFLKTPGVLRDGSPAAPDGGVEEWHGRIEPCVIGLHASANPVHALHWNPGGWTLRRVELFGRLIDDGDKCVADRRRILWTAQADAARDAVVGWAFWCAEQARQSALRALDAAGLGRGSKADALWMCDPVVDLATAGAAKDAAYVAGDAAANAYCAVRAWASADIRARAEVDTGIVAVLGSANAADIAARVATATDALHASDAARVAYSRIKSPESDRLSALAAELERRLLALAPKQQLDDGNECVGEAAP